MVRRYGLDPYRSAAATPEAAPTAPRSGPGFAEPDDMLVATPTRATWRTVLADAVGPSRLVLDPEGANGEWREMLEQNGHAFIDPACACAPLHGTVIARHLVSAARRPERVLRGWFDLLGSGGRVVLLESAPRRGLLRRPARLFPARGTHERHAPYRCGVTPADASLLLEAAGFTGVRCFALPVPPSAGVHYLAAARRR